ncbi:uncharacterized protein LOC127038146 [Gopherus flavomarginatus]|uniref:uncharacterized protein LOC127038146 n=1 Tax=Gopherus flavomarginatus TaxID=286002 RepID=UPI0021CBD884|nr:uncharacterized protein LOC127038146 [Gopherus flavomarginatus]
MLGTFRIPQVGLPGLCFPSCTAHWPHRRPPISQRCCCLCTSTTPSRSHWHNTASMDPSQLTITTAVVSIVNTLLIILEYMQNQAKRRQHEDMDTDVPESTGCGNWNIMVAVRLVVTVEHRLRARQTNTDWWDHIVLQVWDDSQWLRNFRMRKATFLELCELLSLTLKHRNTKMRDDLTVEKRVAIALWKLATPDCYRSVRNKFGVGKSTVGVAVMQVANAITELLLSKVVTLGNVQVIVDGFVAMGFPICGGTIDRMHIPILALNQLANQYVNCKGYFPMVLQALVNHKRCFFDINMEWPGKVHDAHIFRNSGLFEHL